MPFVSRRLRTPLATVAPTVARRLALWPVWWTCFAATASTRSEPTPPDRFSASPERVPRHAAPGEATSTRLRPLDAGEREAFLAGPEDAPIPVDVHYVQSNETRHDLFFSHLRGRGGAYIGIGSDQNFTLMAAARAELAYLLDIDERVTDLHRAYAVLIPEHASAEALIASFEAEQFPTTLERLQVGLGHLPETERRRIVAGLKTARTTLHRHLLRVGTRSRDGRPTTWLSDPNLYDHVREMFQAGRVRVMSGDLSGAQSLRSAVSSARTLGVPVTAIYMSNAEEFFRYTPSFRHSLATLTEDPSAEDAVVLRTIYEKTWEHADLWAYQVQSLRDLNRRIAVDERTSRRKMLLHARREGAIKLAGHRGLTVLGQVPGPSPTQMGIVQRGP